MAQRTLEPLSSEDCFLLLSRQQVGRLVYVDELGPVAVPVNYVLDGNDVIVRIEAGSKRAAIQQARIAFEVDHFEDADRAGWSVLIRGVAAEIPLDHVPLLLHRMHGTFPAPWASGVHNAWLRLRSELVTGRRFRTDRAQISV